MLARNWDAIVASAEAGPLPVETGGVMEELGCGAYGCVLATGDPGTVLKITTDGSEAFFAQGAMELARAEGIWPPGIVEYYTALALPEKFEHRPVFLVWREEAFNVGVLGAAGKRVRQYKNTAGPKSVGAFVALLYDFLAHAGNVFDLMLAWPEREPLVRRLWERVQEAAPPERPFVSLDIMDLDHPTNAEFLALTDRLAWEVHRLYQVSEMMTKLVLGSSVGTALRYYLDKGMVLSDVHPGNVGEVGDDWDEATGDYADPDDWDFAITDPGNMVVISPQWLGLDVPLVRDSAPATRRERKAHGPYPAHPD